MSKESANAAFAARFKITDDMRKGGQWLGAMREWLKSNVPKGDRLMWGSGEPVSIPFNRFEELGLKVAVAAVMEYRDKTAASAPKIGWRTDIEFLRKFEGQALCKIKGEKVPVMAQFSAEDEHPSLMLGQDYYGMHFDFDTIEGWLDLMSIDTFV